MLKNNLLYQDEYMFFTFNGVYSKDYNLMIQNTNNSLTMHINDGTSIDYVSPKYQNGKYVMGVTRSHRSMPYKLVAYGLTRNEACKIANWLKMGTIGFLSFDYAPDWQYNVIISKCGDITLNSIDIQHFIVSFDITFDTIGGTSAENIYDASLQWDSSRVTNLKPYLYGINNNTLVPSIMCYMTGAGDSGADKTEYNTSPYDITLYIHHIGSGQTMLNISANVEQYFSSKRIEIIHNEKTYTLDYKCDTRDTNVFYSYNSNLFFINDRLVEEQDQKGQITLNELSYASQPICSNSPGPMIQYNASDIDYYLTSPYPWFICLVTPTDCNEYYKTTGSYPNSFNGSVYYDTYFNKDTFSDNKQDLQDIITNGADKNIYFGFYDKINIKASANVNIISFTAKQFNDLPLGGI